MKQFWNFADKYEMFPEGANVICAVSGGADSICLLHLINAKAKERKLNVFAAHFNHQLRGAESDRDEFFVRETCRKLGVELFCGAGNVEAYSAEHSIGTEEAARKLRYAFFEETAEKIKSSRVATAHNADDNAETVIMNLARGTGLKGLCGIPPVRGIYVRPMLDTTRDEIMQYLKDNGLSHVEDSTNSDDVYTRNIIRHNVIPVLKNINPGFSKHVCECSELLRSDEKFLSDLAAKSIPLTKCSDGSITVSISKLCTLPEPVASRAVRAAAEQLGKSISNVHVRQVMEVAGSVNPSSKTSLPGDIKITREYDRLVFSTGSREKTKITPHVLIWNAWTDIPECGVTVWLSAGKVKNNEHGETFFFKKNDICDNIIVRSRNIGDSICLNEKQGTKTLKKLFIENKIPSYKRELVPVIADSEGVIAINGFGCNVKRISACGSDCTIIIKRKETKE